MEIQDNIGYQMKKLFKDRGDSYWWKDEVDFAWDDLVMCK